MLKFLKTVQVAFEQSYHYEKRVRADLQGRCQDELELERAGVD